MTTDCNESGMAGLGAARGSARCHSFDGQCGASWCNCDGYEMAANHCKGDISKVMKLMRCSFSTAKRVCDWWVENEKPQAPNEKLSD
jgi:hypothetical protein